MVRISVIVPTRERPHDLQRCLDALSECQDELRRFGAEGTLVDVVVVDDGSLDPVRMAARHSEALPVRLLRNHRPRGAALSRMRAAELTCGEVLAFLDDDTFPRGDWLSVIARRVSAGALAITGRVLAFDAGLISLARQARYDRRYHSLTTGSAVRFFAGGNSAIDAATFRAIGGFSNHHVGGDNSVSDQMWERGTPVLFEPDLVVVHRNGKGWRRACGDALHAGLSQSAPLRASEAIRALRTSGAGNTAAVRNVNRVLEALHVMGGFAPSPDRPGRPGLPGLGSG